MVKRQIERKVKKLRMAWNFVLIILNHIYKPEGIVRQLWILTLLNKTV
jgi:hypothetical protein